MADLALSSSVPSFQRAPSPSRVRVEETDGTFGLFANENVAAGQLVFTIEGELLRHPTRYSVQVGRDAHIDVIETSSSEISSSRHPWRFMNHSCEPTTRIVGRSVIALRDISAGEPVTFNYNTTEWEMAETFTCQCGAPRCLGEIRGYKFLSPELRDALRSTTAEHLLSR